MDRNIKINGNGNTEWKVTEAEFRGYTKSQLLEMNRKFDDMKEQLKAMDDKINCLNKFDKELAAKIGGLSAVVALLTTLFSKMVI